MNSSRNVFNRGVFEEASISDAGGREETGSTEIIVVGRDLDDNVEHVVKDALDWPKAFLYEGENLSADQWNSIADNLRKSLADKHPEIKIHNDIFYEYDQFIMRSYNMNSLYVLAREIITAHIHSHLIKSETPLTLAYSKLKGRNTKAEKMNIDFAPRKSLYHVAELLANGDALGNADRVTAARTYIAGASIPAFRRT